MVYIVTQFTYAFFKIFTIFYANCTFTFYNADYRNLTAYLAERQKKNISSFGWSW